LAKSKEILIKNLKMRKSDIYEIAIKILGLYLIVPAIGKFSDVLYTSTYLIRTNNDINALPFFIGSALSFLILTTFSGVLILKTKPLVKLICKKEDYEETSKLFINKETIYEISLILVGLLTIILTIPDFAFRLNNYVQIIHNNASTSDHDTNFLIISGLKIIVGLIAIIYSKSIAIYLTKERNKTENQMNE